MSVELLQKLGKKIDNAIETIELLRLQVEELEEKKTKLHDEHVALINKHKAWEQNLTMMLDKLEGVEVAEQTSALNAKSSNVQGSTQSNTAAAQSQHVAQGEQRKEHAPA